MANRKFTCRYACNPRKEKPPLVAIQQRLELPPETNTHDYATFNGTYGHCRRCGERAVQPGPCAQASA